MAIDPITLLKQLASGIQPGGLGSLSNSSGSAPIEQSSFADLLSQAQSGSLASGVPVTVSQTANVTLTPDQLKLITSAADKAEAAGLKTALVLIGNQRLTLDVHSRQITGVAQPVDGTAGGIIGGVDGIIDLTNSLPKILSGFAAALTPPPITGPLPMPGSSLSANASINQLLQQLGKTG